MVVTKNLMKICRLVRNLPEGTFIDNTEADLNSISFQATTQKNVEVIRKNFPGSIWKKDFSKSLNWWTYTSNWRGWNLKIYAVTEAPKTCKAIIEKQVVMETVPIGWEERPVEKEVIVGWNCD